eukprot:6330636-Pyramimonas_sp.AAC.1
MDSATRVNVAITRATRFIAIICDGRRFASAAWSRLRVLSEHGRLAGFWVRFMDPWPAGFRSSLVVDPDCDPVAGLATWSPVRPHGMTTPAATRPGRSWTAPSMRRETPWPTALPTVSGLRSTLASAGTHWASASPTASTSPWPPPPSRSCST